MEIVTQRPTLLHQALTTQAAPVKSETEQVKTELSGAQAVTASSESEDNSTASEKSYLSDSRLGVIPSKPKEDQSRIERGYNYDEESDELIYSMTQEPEGDVIYELPSKTARRIRAFLDEVLQAQEKRSLGGEAKDIDPAIYEAKQVEPTQAKQA
ncbi:hypothetical protein ACQU0X_07855 [Pseudovibrio ascidiaceicola]|uniref:hypothetical protein n=1 Tax=Pseudovibrio TaxID=258255 RepID=UPI0007AEA372|nr:hypothetical protein [Pseudovibrio sp. Ad37]KZL14887.1 hypothetical protein PsAD37_04645 [Pseudovibrio sp. Ad37]